MNFYINIYLFIGFGKEVKTDIMEKSNSSFSDFRLSLMMMPADEAALASKAKAVYNWHRKSNYCSSCGSMTVKNSTGSSRTCHKCQDISYPTLSPVGIVLVSDKANSRLLLVRQSRHPKGNVFFFIHSHTFLHFTS